MSESVCVARSRSVARRPDAIGRPSFFISWLRSVIVVANEAVDPGHQRRAANARRIFCIGAKSHVTKGGKES